MNWSNPQRLSGQSFVDGLTAEIETVENERFEAFRRAWEAIPSAVRESEDPNLVNDLDGWCAQGAGTLGEEVEVPYADKVAAVASKCNWLVKWPEQVNRSLISADAEFEATR